MLVAIISTHKKKYGSSKSSAQLRFNKGKIFITQVLIFSFEQCFMFFFDCALYFLRVVCYMSLLISLWVVFYISLLSHVLNYSLSCVVYFPLSHVLNFLLGHAFNFIWVVLAESDVWSNPIHKRATMLSKNNKLLIFHCNWFICLRY